jgi:putative transposase
VQSSGQRCTKINAELRKVLKRLHYPLDVMLTCVRWYAAYPLSLRHLKEMFAERGVDVDHTTMHRWSLKLIPVLERLFRRRKRGVGPSWRMDETYVKVRGGWKYLYRAVDADGATIDVLLCVKRDAASARRFFDRAIARHGAREKIVIDGSPANLATLHEINAQRETPIVIPRITYLNNRVEQDHRAGKHIGQADARVQIVSGRPYPDRRHRTHAHDQEEANDRRRPNGHRPVLCACHLITHSPEHCFDLRSLLRQNPPMRLHKLLVSLSWLGLIANALTGSTAWAQTITDGEKQLIAQCRDSNPSADQAIRACNALIADAHAAIISDVTKGTRIADYAYYNRGLIDSRIGHLVDAIDSYGQVLISDPKAVDALGNRGADYVQTKQYEAALTDLTSAIEIDGQESVLFVNRGAAYEGLGQYQRALQDYTQAAGLAPHDPLVYFDRGNVYSELGQFERAILDYDKAIALDPNQVRAIENRGIAYDKLGRHDEALRDMMTAKKLSSGQ